MKAIAVLFCLFMTGCACTPKTIEVMVPVKCIDRVPAKPVPVIPPKDAGDGTKVRLALDYAARLEKYASELDPIIAGCR